jgi:GAF domain-containing protein
VNDLPLPFSRRGPLNDGFARELARMALVLHDQPDVEQTAERFLQFALNAIDCRYAGLVLVHCGGRLETAAATDPVVEKADRLQAELGEGPSFTVLNDYDSVISGDTAAETRWLRWSSQAAGLGLRSVLSVRLRTPTASIGAFNLFDSVVDRFAAEEDAVAQLLANHAAVALATATSESSLWRAIDARKLIGQAQGILMERFDLTDDQAFAVLRRYSQDNNVKLRDVAQRLIDTRKLPGSV